MKIRNEPKAMEAFVPVENIYVIGVTNAIEGITTDATASFQKLWLYPAKAVSGGVLTANTGTIRLGKTGLTATTKYLPDVLLNSDVVIVYELPLGQRMRLNQIIIKGTAGDGVFFSYT